MGELEALREAWREDVEEYRAASGSDDVDLLQSALVHLYRTGAALATLAAEQERELARHRLNQQRLQRDYVAPDGDAFTALEKENARLRMAVEAVRELRLDTSDHRPLRSYSPYAEGWNDCRAAAIAALLPTEQEDAP